MSIQGGQSEGKCRNEGEGKCRERGVEIVLKTGHPFPAFRLEAMLKRIALGPNWFREGCVNTRKVVERSVQG